MMWITIRIDCNNDAFKPNPEVEVCRILDGVAKKLEKGIPDYLTLRDLFDINGNKVGTYLIGH